ncbi:MAG: Glu/Leu/Phe/Val dehydrogenase dimerization domain-containing protein [Saprospiraceae bacterium]|nr:amino acid dehydrogenase [Saprospiraceae bacterium]MDW8229564.1 Glu/Leu/Phe/Val dehydrogenase dimerization domain-containing protein [Saprospiraceae bacterium]
MVEIRTPEPDIALELEALLTRYKEKPPEIIFEWHDTETAAEGWIVINSLRGGAAGGGTRMRKGLTRDEVVSLAKVMEVKFSVAGPPIGGAKSGINFDPADARRDEVLKRWYRAVLPLLKHYYGTGGDLNVDELKDVVPITESLGLWHPQEGIVRGHLKPSEGQQIRILGQLRHGCAKVVEDPRYLPQGGSRPCAVADLITGYGVAESVRHFYDLYHDASLVGKTAIIQGWGNVSSAAACYLAQEGVRIVGIIDREGGLIRPHGLSANEVYALFHSKLGNRLNTPDMLPFDVVNQEIWHLGADIFIPGAASRLISREQVDALLDGGIEVIACGANVPFVDDEVFFGPTAHYVDRYTALIPDFIANCGMARVFAYLMQPDVSVTDEAIFNDASYTIRCALKEIIKKHAAPNNISSNALYLALKKLEG